MEATMRQFIPVLIPLVVIAFGIAVVTLLDLRKQTSTRGPKWIWVLVIFFIQFIGPLAYFTMGRKEE